MNNTPETPGGLVSRAALDSMARSMLRSSGIDFDPSRVLPDGSISLDTAPACCHRLLNHVIAAGTPAEQVNTFLIGYNQWYE